MMPLLQKTKTIIVVVSAIVLTTTFGCQDLTTRTDDWKQEQIGTMYRNYAQEFPQVAEITATQLQQLRHQGKKLVLVDVRSPAEIAVSHIPGAITAQEFESNLAKYGDAMIVAYCTIGYRSGRYAQKLQGQGVKIVNLAGSLLAWSHAGGELINEKGTTNKVHVFGRQWRLTAEDYEPVW